MHHDVDPVRLGQFDERPCAIAFPLHAQSPPTPKIRIVLEQPGSVEASRRPLQRTMVRSTEFAQAQAAAEHGLSALVFFHAVGCAIPSAGGHALAHQTSSHRASSFSGRAVPAEGVWMAHPLRTRCRHRSTLRRHRRGLRRQRRRAFRRHSTCRPRGWLLLDELRIVRDATGHLTIAPQYILLSSGQLEHRIDALNQHCSRAWCSTIAKKR